MDSTCIKQTLCKVLKIFQYGKYLVAYVLKSRNEKCRVLKMYGLFHTAYLIEHCLEIITIQSIVNTSIDFILE